MADPSVIIDFEPNWDIPPEMAYAFNTVIQITPRWVEQRRPLLPSATRSMKCNYVLEGGEAQRLVNTLIYGSSRLVCVPIYSEPMFSSNTTGNLLPGAAWIGITNDVTYFWNLAHCSYLILLNFVTNQSQMLKVSSVVGSIAYLDGLISGSWSDSQTVIYPAFAGIVKAFDKTPASDLVFSVEAEFEEFTEHAEATPTATSLPAQLCPEDSIGGSFILISFSSFTEVDSPGHISQTEESIRLNRPSSWDWVYAYKTMNFTHPVKIRFTLRVNSITANPSSPPDPVRLLSAKFGSTQKYLLSLYLSSISPMQFSVGGDAFGDSMVNYSSTPLVRYLEMIQSVVERKVSLNVYSDPTFTTLEASSNSVNSTYASLITEIQVFDCYSFLGGAISLEIEEMKYADIIE